METKANRTTRYHERMAELTKDLKVFNLDNQQAEDIRAEVIYGLWSGWARKEPQRFDAVLKFAIRINNAQWWIKNRSHADIEDYMNMFEAAIARQAKN